MITKYFFSILIALILCLTYNMSAIIRCGERLPIGHDNNNKENPDYAKVDIDITYHYEDGEKVGIKNIYCYDNGCTGCPECSFVRVDNDPLDQGFLDISANLMNDFVNTQINLGILSGLQNFDTFYNGILVFRNVSWNQTINQGLTNSHTIMFVITPNITQ